MNVSSVYAYNSAISRLYGLAPAGSVGALGSTSGIGNALSLAGVQSSISSTGTLLGNVETLRSAAQALADAGQFTQRSVATSDSKVATAGAAAGTANGRYAVEVKQLAQAQTLTTAAQASSLTRLGSGATTLEFQFASGESRQVTVSADNNTLGGIASAINAAGIGVTAEVVSSAAGYQLKMTGQSGAANAYTVAATGNAAVGGLVSYAPGGSSGASLGSAARNAEGLINGNAFVSGTNTVNSGGLTLDLRATGKTVLSVAPDSRLTQAVSDFVGAYNAVQTSLNGLGGDGLGLNSAYLRGQLSAALDSTAKLAQVGIGRNTDGTLSLNAKTLEAAIAKSPSDVASVLSSPGTGLAQRVDELTDGALSPKNLLKLTASSLYSSAFDSGYGYLGQLGMTGSNGTGYSGLASQWLLYQLGNSGTANEAAGASGAASFLQSLLAQQSLNTSLLSALG